MDSLKVLLVLLIILLLLGALGLGLFRLRDARLRSQGEQAVERRIEKVELQTDLKNLQEKEKIRKIYRERRKRPGKKSLKKMFEDLELKNQF